MNEQAQHWIQLLNLQPHPEGGYYRETYRATQRVLSAAHHGSRAALTSIYYLLAEQQFSAWHRVASDECWFFHAGSDLDIFCLQSGAAGTTGTIQTTRIGLQTGRFEITVQAGTWFAARPAEGHTFSLVSCVVAPGFEFTDFTLATRTDLDAAGFAQHPQRSWLESMLASSTPPLPSRT